MKKRRERGSQRKKGMCTGGGQFDKVDVDTVNGVEFGQHFFKELIGIEDFSGPSDDPIAGLLGEVMGKGYCKVDVEEEQLKLVFHLYEEQRKENKLRI